MRPCKVISVNDPTGTGEITVDLGNHNYVEATPILPKLFHVRPKIGELVLVDLADDTNQQSQAWYFGPIISQEHKMAYEQAQGNPIMRGSQIKPDVSPNDIDRDHVRDLVPGDGDVSVRSRKSSEVRLTDDDVRIMAGIRKMSDANAYGMVFNTTHPSFIKNKYHYTPLDNNTESTSSVVADKIFLLSPASKEGNAEVVIDSKELLTDEKLNELLKDAYKLPYGEKLVELFKVLIEAFVNHTHPFIQLPPSEDSTMEKLKSTKNDLLDNERLLSDSIRIN